MKKTSEWIVKNKILIVVISFALLILSIIGMNLTKINYDILVYLPSDIETIEGQKILTDDFKMGAYAIVVAENMNSKEILDVEEKIKNVDTVLEVVSLYDVVGKTVPIEYLPEEIVSKLHSEKDDLLFVTFSNSTSDEETLNAVEEIRKITPSSVTLGGMSSVVLDTMNLSETEVAIYVVIAVGLCLLILELSLDSYIVPVLLLANIGFAIMFNMGTNIFLGEISYITKALVAVLQLGVTTDFSIFLYHSYENKKKEYKTKEEAMAKAITETFSSVLGSSLTTIAGFLVLCFMKLTLGMDLGIVMAKGVLLGVITVVTLFPSLLLLFDKYIQKTSKKEIIFKFKGLNKFVIKYHIAIFVVFLVLLIPLYQANSKVDVYYKLDKSLPETLESISTNTLLKDNFNIVSLEMIIIDSNLKIDQVKEMTQKIENVDGVDFALSTSKLKEMGLDEVIDMSSFENDKYQVILVNSIYDIATDELNAQTDAINDIIKNYDKNGIVAGEGPLTKDLIEISDIDFRNVNYSSIACIFIILFFVLKSFSLPVLLIAVIESAIFANMSVSYFGGSTLPFIAPIVLGTIQLGATIDYAILTTTTYLEKRKTMTKNDAISQTLDIVTKSVFVSAMCFFAATFGVGIYSDIDLIGSICNLISRGAIISMAFVVIVLPSVLLIFDKMIMKTSVIGGNKMKNKSVKVAAIMGVMLLLPYNLNAATKNETVYGKLNYDGTVKSVLVNEQLLNNGKNDMLEDYSELKNILNIGNDNKFTQIGNDLNWNAYGKDIIYQGTTDKTLPVNLQITYKLNDETKNIDEIIGKSGRVTINLKYTNNLPHTSYINGKSEKLYTPMLVTMATLIDTKGNTNFEVNNGKLVNNGLKNLVVGMSMPGMSESLGLDKSLDEITISYDTEKFELSSIYSVITPKMVSKEDLNIFNGLDKLYSGANELSTNMKTIENGSKELANGSNLLKTTLSDNITALKTAEEEGICPLTDEELAYIKASASAKAASKFNTETEEGLTNVYNISNEAWTKVQMFMNSEAGEEMTSATSNVIKNILINYFGGGETGETLVQYYGACALENTDACNALTAAGYDYETVKTSIETPIITLTMNLAENLTKKVAVMTAEETAKQTAGETSVLVAKEVATSARNKTISSLETLYQGISTLDKGINDLKSGVTKYKEEGIDKLVSLVNSDVQGTESRVNKLIELSNDYNSFAGTKTDSETKFILTVDSKKVENKTAVKTVEKTKKSLWQRIKDLF